MPHCFGEAAAQLCAASSILLGWRPDHFWNSTPFELELSLRPTTAITDAPASDLIDELRRRFPDE
jgi:hypothetical protein